MSLSPERQREYQRQWMARRRSDWFADKQCVDCDATTNLHLERKDPTSTPIPSGFWSWAQHRRDIELRRCVVRCKSCTTYDHNRSPRIAHLNEATRRQIQRRRDAGMSVAALAEEYGAPPRQISAIVSHK